MLYHHSNKLTDEVIAKIKVLQPRAMDKQLQQYIAVGSCEHNERLLGQEYWISCCDSKKVLPIPLHALDHQALLTSHYGLDPSISHYNFC